MQKYLYFLQLIKVCHQHYIVVIDISTYEQLIMSESVPEDICCDIAGKTNNDFTLGAGGENCIYWVMEDGGVPVTEITIRRPYEIEYPTQRVYVLADKEAS